MSTQGFDGNIWLVSGLGLSLPVYFFKRFRGCPTAPRWDLTGTILNVNPLRYKEGIEGIALPSLLCFTHQKVERRAHLCTSTYRVHFYLFTEGYFQYTVVQLYFVEIWYIEEWGEIIRLMK